MRAVLENIRQKPELHKKGVAFGLSFVITLAVFFVWANERGIVGDGKIMVNTTKAESRNLTVSNIAVTPVESSKLSFISAMGEIKKSYQDFKNSLSSVFVPFITGIEIYQK